MNGQSGTHFPARDDRRGTASEDLRLYLLPQGARAMAKGSGRKTLECWCQLGPGQSKATLFSLHEVPPRGLTGLVPMHAEFHSRLRNHTGHPPEAPVTCS